MSPLRAKPKDEPSIPVIPCPHCGKPVPPTTVIIHKGDGHQSGANAKAKIDKRTQFFGLRIFPRNSNGFATVMWIALGIFGISLWKLSNYLLESAIGLTGTPDSGAVGRIFMHSIVICGPLLLLTISSALVILFGLHSLALAVVEDVASCIVKSDRAARKRAHILSGELRDEFLNDGKEQDEPTAEREKRFERIDALRCSLDSVRNRHGFIVRFLRAAWVFFFADEEVIALRDDDDDDDEDDDWWL